jgi:hypothetical protein
MPKSMTPERRPLVSRRSERVLLVTLAVFVGIAAGWFTTHPPVASGPTTGSEVQGEFEPYVRALPTPVDAEGRRVLRRGDGIVQLSFTARRAFPSLEIAEFYGEWASDQGWVRVGPDEGLLSGGEWESCLDHDGADTRQYTSHWRSPDSTVSLILALSHRGDLQRQAVHVLLSPYVRISADEQRRLAEAAAGAADAALK